MISGSLSQPPPPGTFSWVCAWPFTQVTRTCSLFMSTLPLLTLPLRGSHSDVFPEPHRSAFSISGVPGLIRGSPLHSFKNCKGQESALLAPVARPSRCLLGLSVVEEEGSLGAEADS